MQTTTQGGNVQSCEAHMPAEIFSLRDMNYTGVFDAAGAKRQAPVPQAIVDMIGGTQTGGAYLTKPEVWSDLYLQYIFNPSLARPAYTPTYTLVSVNSTTLTPTPTPQAHKSNAGAIAGGVVGGAVVLAVISIIIFILLRRKAAKKRGAELGGTMVEKDEFGRPAPPFTSNLPSPSPQAELPSYLDHKSPMTNISEAPSDIPPHYRRFQHHEPCPRPHARQPRRAQHGRRPDERAGHVAQQSAWHRAETPRRHHEF